MTTLSKTAALKSANLFTVCPGGVQFPRDLSNPDGAQTMQNCSDAPLTARQMRVTYALQLMGYEQDVAEFAVDQAVDTPVGRNVNDLMDEALRHAGEK